MPEARLGDRTLYFESHGDHAGTPLVMIMGVGGSCRGWLPLQIPDFSKERRVVIFDNRGVDRSPDDGAPFSTRDLASDVLGLLDHLGIGRADALGAFLGGMVCQELALAAPERIERLVLVGTYARPDAKRRMLLTQWKVMAGADPSISQDLLLRNRMLWTLQDETLEDTELIEAMIDFFRRDGLPLTSDLFQRQVDACLGHDCLDRLADIRHPTLALCGQNDQLTPPRLMRELCEGLPDARLVVLPYGGHLIEAESAERFNHAVLQFLAEDR